MGALHDGHLALIQRAVDLGRPVVLSIFVNPTQFGPGEDFDHYPRPFDRDVALAGEAGAEAVFAPDVSVMYPDGIAAAFPEEMLPAVATEPGLEDRCRPGHFAGVATVVSRLFDLVQPGHAVFGEKDYQQLAVIRALVSSCADRWPGLVIHGHPTLREPDGLALSSRNAYLTPEERPAALGVIRALRLAAGMGSEGRDVRRIEEAMRAELVRHHLGPEYAVVRDPVTLATLETVTGPARALVAARLGRVRLIDNVPVGNEL